MIRIAKSETAPASLSTTKSYNGEDVLKQLLTDQHKKCYICERILVTDFEVEHLLSVVHHPELAQAWKNLHLACRYCNGRKSDVTEQLLVPTEENIEDELKQEIDFPNNMALFTPVKESICHQQTAQLLRKLFNGIKSKLNCHLDFIQNKEPANSCLRTRLPVPLKRITNPDS